MGTARPTARSWRIVMVRIAHDPETQLYFERRVKEGKTTHEVIRILKRYVAREVYRWLPRARSPSSGSGFPPFCRPPGPTFQRFADPQLGPPSRTRAHSIRACPHLE